MEDFSQYKKRETSHTTVNVEGRDSLDTEIPEKVAMTLAALSGVVSFGETRESLQELNDIASEIIMNYVILLLEGNFESHTRSKKMIMSELQKSVREKLK